MTASSVELFPCRVQLMGLPRSTTGISSVSSGSTNLRNLSIGLNRRPPIQKVQKVSRNLFGAPDPIEMKKLYEQETERQHKYVLGRYNFDTKSLTDATRNKNSTDEYDNIKHINSSFKQPTTFPTLIQQEQKQYDQRRQGEKQTLCRTSSEETPSPKEKISNHANILSKVMRRCCEYTTLSPAVERQKPYIRQSLLTEKFNIRKSKVRLSRKPKCYRVGTITTNSLKATKNLEVVPHVLEDNACNIKNEEDTKSICNKACACACTLADNRKDSKSAVVCGDKHTAVSLQLVVSTKNLS